MISYNRIRTIICPNCPFVIVIMYVQKRHVNCILYRRYTASLSLIVGFFVSFLHVLDYVCPGLLNTAQCMYIRTHSPVAAKLDEDDPAKMSLAEKMKMFNSKLTHKPPVAGLPRSKEDRVPRASRLRTMPVLASQVQEALDQNERMTKSLTQEDVPRDNDFQLKMELFRSASAKNTSLAFLMRQNSKFRSLGLILFLLFLFGFLLCRFSFRLLRFLGSALIVYPW